MSDGPATKNISCPPGTWTNVLSIAGRLIWPVTYTVDVPTGTRMLYRRYGACIPPYMEGSFTTRTTFTAYPWDVYVRVDLRPAGNNTVTATVG